MPHWHFRIADEPAGEEDWAHVDIQDYNQGIIHLGEQWLAGDDTEKIVALIHEVLHCPVHRLEQTISVSVEAYSVFIPEHMRPQFRAVMEAQGKAWAQREEELVEGMARSLVEVAPDPPW